MRHTITTEGPIRSAAIAIAVVGMAQLFATPASAGLLDFLFAPTPRPAVVAAPAEVVKASAAITAQPSARPSRPRVTRKDPAGPRPYIAPQIGAGPLGPFLHDATLRRGDVVATANGLMVFQGKGGGVSHKPSDFAPVANAATKREELIALDQTMRRTPSAIEEVSIAMKPQPADHLTGALTLPEGRALMAGVQSASAEMIASGR